MENLESITKQQAKDKAIRNVAKYFDDAIGELRRAKFVTEAKRLVPDKLKEIEELKAKMNDLSLPVQDYCLACAGFEHLSKEVIRFIGIRML